MIFRSLVFLIMLTLISCSDSKNAYASIQSDGVGYVASVTGDSVIISQVIPNDGLQYDEHSIIIRYHCSLPRGSVRGVISCRMPGMPIIDKTYEIDANGRLVFGDQVLFPIEDKFNYSFSDPARILSDLKHLPSQ